MAERDMADARVSSVAAPTWDEVMAAARDCPFLYRAATLAMHGTCTREEAMTAAALALSKERQALVDAEVQRRANTPVVRLSLEGQSGRLAEMAAAEITLRRAVVPGTLGQMVDQCVADRAALQRENAAMKHHLAGEAAQAITPHAPECERHQQEPCTCDQPLRMKAAERAILAALVQLVTPKAATP